MNILSRIESLSKDMVDFNSNKRCHHFSFILKRKKILAIGTNRKKTHPYNLKIPKISKETGEDVSAQKYVCSELDAIRKLKRKTNIDTKKCILINIRYDRNGNLAYSKPCMSCECLLEKNNFKKIVWTDAEGNYVNVEI
jgi:hypothetical protein